MYKEKCIWVICATVEVYFKSQTSDLAYKTVKIYFPRPTANFIKMALIPKNSKPQFKYYFRELETDDVNSEASKWFEQPAHLTFTWRWADIRCYSDVNVTLMLRRHEVNVTLMFAIDVTLTWRGSVLNVSHFELTWRWCWRDVTFYDIDVKYNNIYVKEL